jgi:uncharacterized protein YggE
VWIQFDRENRAEIEEDLISKATQDARRQAELMARGAGANLGPVFALSQVSLDNVWSRFGVPSAPRFLRPSASAFGTPRAPKQLFVPSTVTFQASVNALYELRVK